MTEESHCIAVEIATAILEQYYPAFTALYEFF